MSIAQGDVYFTPSLSFWQDEFNFFGSRTVFILIHFLLLTTYMKVFQQERPGWMRVRHKSILHFEWSWRYNSIVEKLGQRVHFIQLPITVSDYKRNLSNKTWRLRDASKDGGVKRASYPIYGWVHTFIRRFYITSQTAIGYWII